MTEIAESQLDRTKRKGKRRRCRGCGGALPRTRLYETETRCINCRKEAGEVIRVIAEPTGQELSVPRFRPEKFKLTDEDRATADAIKKIVSDVCELSEVDDILHPQRSKKNRAGELFKYCLVKFYRFSPLMVTRYLGITTPSNINVVIRNAEGRLKEVPKNSKDSGYKKRFLEIKGKISHL